MITTLPTKKMDTLTEEEQALARAMKLDANAAPIATPEMLAAGLQWVLAMVRKELAECPGAGGECHYLTFSKLRQRFGYSKERMSSYLRRMRAENKVRIIQPTDENGKTGDCRYHVDDVESWMLIAGHGKEKH